jgi:hypothetical protein
MEQKKPDGPTKFWVSDPCILLSDLQFFPTAGMTREEKLNALTRLAVILAIVMYLMEYKHWHTFLLIAVLTLVVVEYASKNKDNKSQEGFTITPTRIGDDFHETVVSPTFSEEVRILPPAYDLYSDVELTDIPFEEPMRPQSYPYGQYLSRTNLLPSDEYLTHMNPTGGAKTAREYANNAWTRHDMANRENLTRVFKKSLARRFRHSQLNDAYSPFHSY